MTFQQPTSMSVMVYNVLGADLSSSQEHIESIVHDYAPTIIILTETRLHAPEAYNLAEKLSYRQVITEDPVDSNGGIWILCNLRNLAMKEIMHIEKEILVDLLKN